MGVREGELDVHFLLEQSLLMESLRLDRRQLTMPAFENRSQMKFE